MSLTTQQLATLKSAIAAETDPSFVSYRTANDLGQMAAWLNAASPFIAWRSSVSIKETGQAFNGADWAAMTSANHTRLQTVAQYLSSYNAGLADVRAMFNDIWSGAGGTATRASLLALWKRAAMRFEKVFATGTGTDGAPGLFVVEGMVGLDEIVLAMNS